MAMMIHFQDKNAILDVSKKKMGCPALGILVAFLKQPDALPGRASPKNKNYIYFELLLIHL
jgi:hypothetical protein